MVDLNSPIPVSSGLQLQYGSWINDEGLIAAQAVLTSGPDTGASRAVLLIPDEDCGKDTVGAPANAVMAQAASVSGGRTPAAALRGAAGRPNRALFKPFSPALFGAQKSAY